MSLLPLYKLETLGTLALRGASREISIADKRQQRRRLALLAVLAAAGDRGRSRDQLLLLFWPDSTEKKARHSLDQLLYSVRSSVHEAIVAGVNPICLNGEVIGSDLADFEQAVRDRDFQNAVSLYEGPFLDGFYLSETKEFEDWLDAERRRLNDRLIESLDHLALHAEAANDHTAALRWRQRLADADPSSSRYATALMRAHANAGDYSAAFNYAERYQRIAARELGLGAVPEVERTVAEIRERITNEGVSRTSTGVPIEGASLPVLSGAAASVISRASAADTTLPQPPRRISRAFFIAGGIVAAAFIALLVLYRPDDGHATPNSQPHPVAAARIVSLRHNTRNVAAYDLYRRGQDPVLLRNDSTALEGVRYFSEAIRIDPSFAAAHAGLANMYIRLAMSSRPLLPQKELRQRAEFEALKAITLDDSLADGHAALGYVKGYWPGDLHVAERELKHAAALDSMVPHVYENLAITHVVLARAAEALGDAHRAVAMDPLSPTARATLAGVLYVLGRCTEALPLLDSLDDLKPPLLRVAITHSLCYATQQRWAEAAQVVERQSATGNIRASGLYGMALARSGRRDEALSIRTRLREAARTNSAAHFDVATVSLGLRDMDDVLSELRLAVENGFIPYEVMGPVFSSMRDDARAKAVLARRGIAVTGSQVVEAR